MRGGFPLALVLAVCAPSVARAQAQPLKIATVPLAAKKIDVELVTILDDLVINRLDQLGRFQVVSTKDVEAMLGLEKMKDAIGCDSAQCAAAIGGALGVDLLLTGSAARLGNELILTLTLIDVRAAGVAARAQRRGQADESTYPALVDEVVADVMRKVGGDERAVSTDAVGPSAPLEATPPVSEAVAAVEPVPATTAPAATAGPDVASPARGRRILGWTSLGLAGASAVGAGVLLLLAPSEDSIRDDEYAAFIDAPYPAAAQAAYEEVDAARRRHNTMVWTGFALVGVTALAGGLAAWALLGGGAPASVAVSPTGGGAFVTLSAEWQP